jgi:hypothetical protein
VTASGDQTEPQRVENRQPVPDGDDKPGQDEGENEEDASDERMYSTVPLETEDGVVVIRQQNVGKDNEIGGGEWPDPDTPPQRPAPGAS